MRSFPGIMAVGGFFLDFEPMRTRFGASRGVRPRRLHAIDATRVHLTMKWVVSFVILSSFKDTGAAHPVGLDDK